MNSKNKLLSIIIGGFLFIALVLLFILNINKLEYKLLYENISVFENDNSKYIYHQAPKDISFALEVAVGEKPEYAISDKNGDTIDVNLRKLKGGKYEITPFINEFIKGGEYIISLGNNTTFENELLKEARDLTVVIEKDNIEHYELTDLVFEIDGLTSKEDQVTLNNEEVEVGNVILGKNDNSEYYAYKIESIKGKTAKVSTPKLDEIYSELEIYGDYSLNLDDLELNKEIEAEIVESVKESGFFKSLVKEVYALEIEDIKEIEKLVTFKAKIEEVNEDYFKVGIEISLIPQKNGVTGSSKLVNYEITITSSHTFSLNTHIDIDFKNEINSWDVSVANSIDNEFSITVKSAEDKDSVIGLEFESVEFAVNKIGEAIKDNIIFDKNIFKKSIYTNIPGVFFKIEFGAFAEIEHSLQGNLSIADSTFNKVGIRFKDKKLENYSTYDDNKDKSIAVSISGKAGMKLGLKANFRFVVISEKIGFIGINSKLGVYGDLYGVGQISYPSLTKSGFLYAEPGGYYKGKAEAYINYLVDGIGLSIEVEKKFPWEKLTFGEKEIIISIMSKETKITAINGEAQLPELVYNYYDIKDGKVKVGKVDNEYIQLSFDENEIQITDGKFKTLTSNDKVITVKINYHNREDLYEELEIQFINEEEVQEADVTLAIEDDGSNDYTIHPEEWDNWNPWWDSVSTIETTEIYNKDGLTITALEISKDEAGNPSLKLYLNNESNIDLSVGTRSVVINNYMAPLMFPVIVEAETDLIVDVSLIDNDLIMESLGDVEEISIRFLISQSGPNANEEYSEQPECLIRTSEYRVSDHDNYEHLKRNGGLHYLYYKGINIYASYEEGSKYWEEGVRFFISNEGDDDCVVFIDDLTINGQSVNTYFSAMVDAKRYGIDYLEFSRYELDNLGIKEIDEINFTFTVRKQWTIENLVTDWPVFLDMD